MPVVSRKQLRQALGTERLMDTLVAYTEASLGSLALLNRFYADAQFTADNLYARSWARFHPSVAGTGVDFRVATFNAASGAWIGNTVAAGTRVASGIEFEIHQKLSPRDKDLAIDRIIRDVRLRQEIGVQPVDDQEMYVISSANASPHHLFTDQVYDVYYFADPSNSLNRDRRDFDWWEIQTTPTGTELRIKPAIDASYQIILDALLSLTLAGSDVATVNIPDTDLVLAGAEAQAWGMLAANDPGQNAAEYKRKRSDAARMYSALLESYARKDDRALPRFGKPF